jgi:hypothetical protein
MQSRSSTIVTNPSLRYYHLAAAAVVLLGAVLLLSPRASRASDVDPEVPPNPTRLLVGLWQGTFQSETNPALQGEFVFDISHQEHRVFRGTVSADTFTPVDPCRGVIAESNRINFVSESGDGKICAHGELVGDTMFLEYHAILSDGTTDFGTLMLIGDGGGPTVDSL